MGPFVFLAGFAAGTLVTLVFGMIIDRVFPDEVGSVQVHPDV